MWDICELWCNMWLVMLNHVRSWLVCWLNRDPSWYSMDYWIYMGSSVIVWLPWWLLLYLCSYKLDGSVTQIAANKLASRAQSWHVTMLRVCVMYVANQIFPLRLSKSIHSRACYCFHLYLQWENWLFVIANNGLRKIAIWKINFVKLPI